MSTSGGPSVAWTLGHKDGERVMWCVFCGRNCLADRIPYMPLPQDGKPPNFACVCCYFQECDHSEPIIVTCDRCRRPLTSINFAGGRIGLSGSIRPEGSARSRSRVSMLRNGEVVGMSPVWGSRIWDVSANGTPWTSPQGPGSERFKFVCSGRKHHLEWVVSYRALRAAYVLALRTGVRKLRASDVATAARHQPRPSCAAVQSPPGGTAAGPDAVPN